MMIFIAVCLGLLVVEIGVLVVALALTVLHVHRTVKSVEVLAYRLEEEVERFSTSMRSGWMRALQATASMAGGFFGGRRND